MQTGNTWRGCALALAVAASTAAVAAEKKITLAAAPAGLLKLMEANRDGDDGCALFTKATPATVVATVYALDARRSLVVMPCAPTRKFDMERVFVATGDDFANATPARLPVPKSRRNPYEASGFISDVMQAEFNEAKKELWSSAWIDGDCWMQRTWVWRAGRFQRLTNKRSCADA